MMLPFDPIMMLVVVVGVFAYFALKGSGAKKKEKSIYDIYKEIGEKSSEYGRYQERLRDHS